MSWVCDLCHQDFDDATEPAVGVEEMGPVCVQCDEGGPDHLSVADEDPELVEQLAAEAFDRLMGS